jgi:hypothetical protein
MTSFVDGVPDRAGFSPSIRTLGQSRDFSAEFLFEGR